MLPLWQNWNTVTTYKRLFFHSWNINKPNHNYSNFSFSLWDGVLLVTHAGVQWLSLGSLHVSVLGSSDSPASSSWVAEITKFCHYAQLIFVFLVETGFHRVGQAGLRLLTSGDPPVSASQSAGITGVSHCAWPGDFLKCAVFKLTWSNHLA